MPVRVLFILHSWLLSVCLVNGATSDAFDGTQNSEFGTWNEWIVFQMLGGKTQWKPIHVCVFI